MINPVLQSQSEIQAAAKASPYREDVFLTALARIARHPEIMKAAISKGWGGMPAASEAPISKVEFSSEMQHEFSPPTGETAIPPIPAHWIAPK